MKNQRTELHEELNRVTRDMLLAIHARDGVRVDQLTRRIGQLRDLLAEQQRAESEEELIHQHRWNDTPKLEKPAWLLIVCFVGLLGVLVAMLLHAVGALLPPEVMR